LRGEAVKNLWYKGAALPRIGVGAFSMPALKDDVSIGRNADLVEREAFQAGYEAGERAGFEMGQQKAQVLMDRLDALLGELQGLRGTIIREVEPQCVELAVDIAKKILVKALTIKPETVVAMTREALMKLERTGQITIKINPALYDMMMKHKPQLTGVYPDIAFDIDPSVTKFGSVVVGPVEEVVTELDDQLRSIIKDMAAQHGDH
jgi:flagellar biosynthesis/type III secretory pathway protein FliH